MMVRVGDGVSDVDSEDVGEETIVSGGSWKRVCLNTDDDDDEMEVEVDVDDLRRMPEMCELEVLVDVESVEAECRLEREETE